MSIRTTLAGAAGVLALAFACAAASAQAAPTILADVPQRSDVRDLGPAGAGLSISLAVSLPYRDQAALEQLVALQSDPGSPLYGHFLTNAQFGVAFAPRAAEVAQVAAILEAAGFHIARKADPSELEARAPAPLVERFFHTEIRRVAQSGRGVRYLNRRPAILPAALSDRIASVDGFDDLQFASPAHALAASGERAAIIGGPLQGPDGGLGPLATANAYDLPVQHGADGSGYGIAVAIDADSSDADLATFTSFFGIVRTGTVTHVPVDGGEPYSKADSLESTLDTETIGSLAPGADLFVYNFGARFTNKEIGDAYDAIVSDNRVAVVSSSFGFCELPRTGAFNKRVDQITQQGAAKGISFVASTGDTGAGGKCGGPTRGQDVPAALHYFTAVGGTDLSVDATGRRTKETAWPKGGGGPSVNFRLPPYQAGLAGLCSTSGRNLPDLASAAAREDSFYFFQAWKGPIGGTSWAAPTIAAFLVDAASLRGKPLGWANPALYAAFRKRGYALFTDITLGNNGYPAGPGFDCATGLGAVRGEALAQAL